MSVIVLDFENNYANTGSGNIAITAVNTGNTSVMGFDSVNKKGSNSSLKLVNSTETSHYISFPVTLSSANGCTFSFWFRYTSPSTVSNGLLFGTSNMNYYGADMWILCTLNNGNLEFSSGVQPGTTSRVELSVSLSSCGISNNGNWNHVCWGTTSGGIHRLVINGTQYTYNGTTAWTQTQDINRYIARDQTFYIIQNPLVPQVKMTGNIDLFKYFNNCLTVSQMQNLYSTDGTLGGYISQGYTATQLRNIGYTATQLKNAGYTGSQLKTAGYTAIEMKTAGYTATELKTLNYTATEMRTAGYTATELKTLNYTATELKTAGYTATQMKTAGYTATELKTLNYTATELKTAGYTATEMKVAGYTATEMKSASYTATQLKTAGYTGAELKTVGYTATELKTAGYTATELKILNYTATEMKSAGYTATELKASGYTAAELKSVAYTGTQLYAAGYTATEMKDASYTVSQLKTLGYTATELKEARYTATEMKAGYMAIELKAVGYTESELKAAGYTALEMKNASYTATELKALGYTATEMKAAVYTAAELKAVGYTATQMKAAAYTASQLKTATYIASELKTAGYTAIEMKNAAYTATELKSISYTAAELKSAGFTATELKTAGFTATELKTTGFTATELKTAGFTASQLKTATYTATELKAIGYTATEMKSGLYTLEELKAASYTATELKSAGFTATELKTAGFTATELKEAFYPVADMKAAGYTATQMKNVGYTTGELRPAGELVYTLSELLDAGFTGSEIRHGGFNAKEFRLVGFTIPQLQTIGFSFIEILTSGFSSSELIAGGYTGQVMRTNGFTARELYNDLGYTTVQIFEGGYQPGELLFQLSANGVENGYVITTIPQLIELGYTLAQFRLDTTSVITFSMLISYYTPAQLKHVGYTALDFRTNGYVFQQPTDLTFEELLLQIINVGYDVSDLKEAGYSALDLKAVGYGASDLKEGGYTAENIIASGYNANDLKNSGFSVSQLKIYGYIDVQILSIGYTAAELRAASYTATQLRPYNYTATQLRTGGYTATQVLSAGYVRLTVSQAGYSILELRSAGLTVSELRIAGFTISQLTAAGIMHTSILTAGFSAIELRLAGFTISQLKQYNYTDAIILASGFSSSLLYINKYTATQLYANNYTALELKNGGYLVSVIVTLGYSATNLKAASISGSDLKNANYTAIQLIEGGYTKLDIIDLGYNISDLKTAGFTATELRVNNVTIYQLIANGYSDSEILGAGFTATSLKTATYSASQLQSNGYTITNLRDAGYTTNEIIPSGFSVSSLRTTGYTSQQLKNNGFNVASLKTGGYSDSDILSIGYSADELRTNGYSAVSLKNSNYEAVSLKLAGYTDGEILAAGFTASQLRLANYSASQLRTNNYTIEQLRTANYSTQNILAAGYSVALLRTSSYTASQLRQAGFTVENLVLGGYIASEILPLNYSASALLPYYSVYQLKAYNYTPTQLKTGGFNDSDIFIAEFNSIDLRRAGYSATQLKDNNYTITDLETAGYSMSDILSCGFSSSVLKSNNYIALDLRENGYSISNLIDGGYTDSEILSAGYDALDLNIMSYTSSLLYDNNYTALQLKTGNYADSDILNLGYSVQQLKLAGYLPTALQTIYNDQDILAGGFSAANLKAANYTASQLKINNYSVAQLILANYDTNDILGAGFDAIDLKTNGYTANDLNGYYNANQLRLAGYTVSELQNGNYSTSNILSADYLASSLRLAGYTSVQLKTNHYSALKLRTGGYSDEDVLSIGYSIKELAVADYTVDQMRLYGYSDGTILTGISNAIETKLETPVITSVVSGNSKIFVHFTDSNTNDIPIIGYKYTLNGGQTSLWSMDNNSPLTILGLTNGTNYDIGIYAVNRNGLSVVSNIYNSVVPLDIPNKPYILNAVSENGVISFDYIIENTNGSNVTEYYYSTDSINYVQVEPVNDKIIIQGLNGNQIYNVSMKVKNAVGFSEKSNSIIIKNIGLMVAPTITNITFDNKVASISYTINSTLTKIFYKYSLNNGPYLYFKQQSNSLLLLTNLKPNETYNIKIKSEHFLYGESNESNMVTLIPVTEPSKSTILTANYTNKLITLSVIEGIANGSSITHYYYSINGASYEEIDNIDDGIITINSLINTAITNTIKIKSENKIGMSEESNVMTLSYRILPDKPIITSVISGDNFCKINFIEGETYNSPILCYKYKLSDDPKLYIAKEISNPLIVTNVSNGTNYTIKIKVVCQSGESDYSNISELFMPFGVPEPPTITSLEPRIRSILVNFEPGNNGGLEILGYKYSVNSGRLLNASTSTSPILITDLVDKANFSITLYAYNSQGTSFQSNTLISTPGVPSAPTINTVTVSESNFYINYTPSALTNNAAIQKIFYTFDKINMIAFRSMTNPLVIKGITNGKFYDINISSLNSNGFSSLSNTFLNAIVRIPPSKLIIDNVALFLETASTCYAIVKIKQPVNNGFPITNYKYDLNSNNNFVNINSTSIPLIISNLPINSIFSIRLVATNENGDSEPSILSKMSKYFLAVPAIPVIRIITPSLNTLSINFVKPLINGSEITTYKYSLNDGPFVSLNSNVIPLSIPIENNTLYNVRLIATNIFGDSAPSNPLSKPVSFVYLPPLLSKFNSIVGGNNELNIFFTGSTTRGAAITGYSYSLNAGLTITNTNTTTSPLTITGLINDTSYSVLLYANSAAGLSAPSIAMSGIPVYKVPGIPVIRSIIPLNNSCSIILNNPIINGSPIITYLYSIDGGVTLIDTNRNTESFLIAGLTNGTNYNIQIIAVNALGNSPISLPRSVIPIYSEPSAPVITRVSGGIKSISIMFAASIQNGSAIISYYYSLDNGVTILNANKNIAPIIISNLSSFTTYNVRLYALNDVGFSPVSNSMSATTRLSG